MIDLVFSCAKRDLGVLHNIRIIPKEDRDTPQEAYSDDNQLTLTSRGYRVVDKDLWKNGVLANPQGVVTGKSKGSQCAEVGSNIFEDAPFFGFTKVARHCCKLGDKCGPEVAAAFKKEFSDPRIDPPFPKKLLETEGAGE